MSNQDLIDNNNTIFSAIVQRWISPDMSRDTFFKVSVSSRFVTPKSRLGLGLLRLDFKSRYCTDASKAHKSRKYGMIFGKNWLSVRFFGHSGSWPSLNLPLVTVELNHENLYAWESRSLDTA